MKKPKPSAAATAKTWKAKPRPCFAYERIAQDLEAKIVGNDYPAGSRLPTENILASSFGVNRLTARKALDILARKGRILRQQGRGTFVANSRASAPTVLFVVTDMEEHVFKELYLALAAEVQVSGGRLAGFSWRGMTPPGVELTVAMRTTHSLIVQDCVYRANPGFFEKRKIAAIVTGIDSYTPRRPAYLLPFDRSAATIQAVNYLAAQGHRRIMLASLFDWPQAGALLPQQPEHPLPDVYFAYRNALLINNLDGWHRMLEVKGGDPETNQKPLLEVLSAPKKPTAIVCDMDYRARTVYAAAATLGLRIPGQLSVVGIGNTPWARAFHPALTSVSYQEKQLANIMVRLCAGGPPKEMTHCTVKPELVIRQSSAACPA